MSKLILCAVLLASSPALAGDVVQEMISAERIHEEHVQQVVALGMGVLCGALVTWAFMSTLALGDRVHVDRRETTAGGFVDGIGPTR